MEYRVKLSDRALRDLADIYDFVEADASESAYAWFLEFEKAVYSLERHPERGSPDPKSKRRWRLFFGARPGVYKIMYQIDRRNAVVNVFHIRHGARA